MIGWRRRRPQAPRDGVMCTAADRLYRYSVRWSDRRLDVT